MKAGRGIHDCDDVSVTTGRSARLKNCYKKARKWDRGGIVRVYDRVNKYTVQYSVY